MLLPFMKQFDVTTGSKELVETNLPSGLNDCGIRVQNCTMCTPEYPNVRDVVIIENDITFKSGSFGPEEEALFLAASRLARHKRIPRIILAANSGAKWVELVRSTRPNRTYMEGPRLFIER